MRIKIILSFIVFNLLIFTSRSTSLDNNAINIEVIQLNITECINASSNVYLTPLKGENIRGRDMIKAFMNGWRFDRNTDVYGYTATDDLWTFLNVQNASSNNYEVVRIEINGLQKGSEGWNACMSHINVVANNLMLSVQID